MIINGKEIRPANAEVIEGFRDGYDLSTPEPSHNRSVSYRYGFMCARLRRLAKDAIIDKRMIDWTGSPTEEADEVPPIPASRLRVL